MVIVSCSVPGCAFKTVDVSEALAIALLSNHGLAHQQPPQRNAEAAPAPRGPKLLRPQADIGMSTEDWNIFVRRWEVFRVGNGIDEQSAPPQLFQCAGATLGDSLLRLDPNATSRALPELLMAMRSMAVIPVAIVVLRSELLQIKQERDESFRAFAARVRGKAETCAFTAKCSCGNDVDYTDMVIRDVLLSGIADCDIKREVLGWDKILQKTVNEVIAIVENKEMARNALPSSTMSAVSTFRRQKTQSSITPPSLIDRSQQAPCPDCKKIYHLFSEGRRGWNRKPHRVCIECYRVHRSQRLSSAPSTPQPNIQVVEMEPLSQIATVQSSGDSLSTRGQGTNNAVVLDHHIFTKGEWKRAQLRPHPTLSIKISFDKSRTAKPGKTPSTRAEIAAIADTGAQSDLWSLSDFLSHGFSQDDLFPVTLGLSAANRSPITVAGAFFAKIETTSQLGVSTSCKSMVYVSSSVRAMYLSYDTLLNLGALSNDFPRPESTSANASSTPSINIIRQTNDGCNSPGEMSCSCPQRMMTPTRPATLPFPCTIANKERMKAWLLDRYSTSTFNTCPHRMLPCMEGPEVEIHIDPSATPKACHTPADVPLHWQKRVYEDLLRDEALGVIERVPYGEPVNWCHRMVVTRKHNGSPRRTVDLSPLNKFCKRETFASESPFHLARRIPQDTWKTVTDAWNGYHSVPLRETDRHLTTFITPFGRWRYTRAPQGFVSSGDGYNRRFDAILADFDRKERCVDDTVHYDFDLEQHWWRTIDFLTRVGQAGVVLNPDKFQFSEKTVDFAGFRVSDTTIEPLPKYLDAIRDFPTPTSTTDIRSWFGLVNQVSNYAQLRDMMAPFKPFLSPRCKFSWSAELEKAFVSSKKVIVDAIRQGVEIFDMKKPTCLRPDWSKRGIGYFLLQKHCDCTSQTPNCCSDGWRVTLAGSRFLSPTEQRYAAIEGEALAVAWGLEQTRYFTQGCENLIIITDHKPLVKIFGDRTLDEIPNSRLFRMKQRTLPWHFEIHHLPGTSNQAADATSRHPSPTGSEECAEVGSSIQDLVECEFMAAIQHDVEKLDTLPYELIVRETSADPTMSHLLQLIECGFEDKFLDDIALAQFWPIRDALYIQDGAILYEDRVVVPPSLRRRVLKYLHAAHQGISSMEQRARMVVYWPGMTKDIRDTRHACDACNRNAPSQPAALPISSPPPSTPFEAIFADFFDYGGRHYLVIGDRLSGWVEVIGSNTGSNMAGASGLIRHLRAFFAMFGVPMELSSDGGPEFSAGCTQDFLQRWGVRHRVSSAYFPQSNGRAEVAVKTAKRLLMTNTGPTGSLDHDSFLHAILQLRNTPDPDCSISPAEIVFGRPLRDAFSFVNRLEKYSNPHIRPLWRQAWDAKEDALRTRMARTTETLKEHSHPLRPLAVGEHVFLQNQVGGSPKKWDRSGIVMETLGNDQYWVKVDGSGRLTRRNRRFLRAYTESTPKVTVNRQPQLPSGAPQAIQPKLTISSPDIEKTTASPVGNDHQPDNMQSLPDATSSPTPQHQGACHEPHATGPVNVTPGTLPLAFINLPNVHLADAPDTLSPTLKETPLQTIPDPVPRNTPARRSQRTTRPPKIYEPESGKWLKL